MVELNDVMDLLIYGIDGTEVVLDKMLKNHMLPEMEHLVGVKQALPHTEDAWQHTKNVVHYTKELISDRRGLSYDEQATRLLAALFHDIAKGTAGVYTFSKDDGQWHNPGHAKVGAKMVSEILEEDTYFPKIVHQDVVWLIQHHMDFYHNVDCDQWIKKAIEENGGDCILAARRTGMLRNLIKADLLGTGDGSILQQQNWEQFDICHKYLISAAMDGINKEE